MKLGASMLLAVSCLAVTVIALSGCGGKGTSATSTPTQTTSPAPPLRTISGKVSYTGTIKPTHQIIVVANRSGEQSPAYSVILQKPGSFTFSNVSDASYSIFAFMDMGDDMGPPQSNEPSGYYDQNTDGKSDQVIIQDGKGIAGIDITLKDPN